MYVIHGQMCFLLTEIYREFYGFLVLLGVISADLRCVFRMLFQAVFRVHVTEITKMSIFWNENDDENNNITCWFQGKNRKYKMYQ